LIDARAKRHPGMVEQCVMSWQFSQTLAPCRLAMSFVLFACTPTRDLEPTPSTSEAKVDSESAAAEPRPEPTPVSLPFVQRMTANEGFVEANIPPDWRLSPDGPGSTPLFEGVPLALQRDGLFLGDERLVAVTDGWLDRSAIERHVIGPLFEQAQEIAARLETAAAARDLVWDGHAILYAHPDTPMGDIVDVVYTLGRHGFMSYQFALAPSVELSHLVERQVINVGIHLDPPKFVKGTPSPEGTTMVVFLANDGMHVGHRPNGPTEPTWDALLTWDANTMAELERHAAQFVAEHPPVEGEQHHKAVFMADPEMPVGRLIEAMIAASGRDCRYQDVWGTKLGDRKRCHIAQRILEAGRAPTTGP
jgi:hypothetical protein